MLYLTLLKFFDNIPIYSCGFAISTSLYKQLCLACIKEVKQVGGMFATSTIMNKKNINNYLDLNASWTTKLTKCFYLIIVMVMGTSPYRQTPNIEIAGYNNPNYEGYISSPTRMHVLRCYFCNYIHLYCVLETLKNTIKLTCF